MEIKPIFSDSFTLLDPADSVVLSWKDDKNISKYDIYRKATPIGASVPLKPPEPIVSGVEDRTFIDKHIETGYTYWYWVCPAGPERVLRLPFLSGIEERN